MRRLGGQSLVEFALVAPILLLLMVAIFDLARGLFFFTQMSAASREAGRQAALSYNRDSNLAPLSSCVAPCRVPGVVPVIQNLAAFGFPVIFQASKVVGSPPSYGTYTPNAATPATAPGTITLAPGLEFNTLYVFVYEIDSSPGATSPRWDCADPKGTKTCLPVRTAGHNQVVVDLKMSWRPVVFGLLGLQAGVVFDAQTVKRSEF